MVCPPATGQTHQSRLDAQLIRGLAHPAWPQVYEEVQHARALVWVPLPSRRGPAAGLQHLARLCMCPRQLSAQTCSQTASGVGRPYLSSRRG